MIDNRKELMNDLKFTSAGNYMDSKMDDLMYQSGLTADGCWDEMDSYDREAIEKFGKLIIQDCIKELEISKKGDPYTGDVYNCEYNTCIDEQIQIFKARFGVN
jgi:hypothetical protein